MSSNDQTFPKGLCVQPQNNWHMAISSHFVFHVSWRVNIAMVVGNLKILTTLQSYWERGENVKKVYFRTCWLKILYREAKTSDKHLFHTLHFKIGPRYLFISCRGNIWPAVSVIRTCRNTSSSRHRAISLCSSPFPWNTVENKDNYFLTMVSRTFDKCCQPDCCRFCRRLRRRGRTPRGRRGRTRWTWSGSSSCRSTAAQRRRVAWGYRLFLSFKRAKTWQHSPKSSRRKKVGNFETESSQKEDKDKK